MSLQYGTGPAIFLALFLVCEATAGDIPSTGAISISGAVKTSAQLTQADLQKLPAQNVDVSFETARGQEHGAYKGVLLLTLLDRAVVIDGPEKSAHLRHTILVSGRDGYTIALSMGEIDPKFEGKTVIVAYEKDGRPLPPSEGVRLIVPLDHHGGRAVRDISRIEIQ